MGKHKHNVQKRSLKAVEIIRNHLLQYQIRLQIKSRKRTKFISNSYQMQTSVSSCKWKQTVVDCDQWVSVFIVWVRTVSSAVRLNSAWSATRLSCDWWILIRFAFIKGLKMPRYCSLLKAAE